MLSFDSTSASLFTNSNEKYTELTNGLDNSIQSTEAKITGSYNSAIDTLQTTLSFLKQFKDLSAKTSLPLNKLEQLKDNFSQSEKIKGYIATRKEEIKALLAGYTKLPQSIAKEFKKIQITGIYYSAQINEYKRVLQDQNKIEKKALQLLSKVPAFQKFMKKNSMLANLFRMPADDPNDPAYLQSLAGLQTRAQVTQLIQGQINAGGPAAMQQVRANLQQAQGQLNQLKDKLAKGLTAGNSLGNGGNKVSPTGGDLEGAFNPEKVKPFLKRFEVGLNIQSQKNTRYFPVTTDLGVSVGYKLNDKSVIGVGAAYKVGWGTGFNHIAITSQGFAIRSFLDIKLKKTFWVTGGYEQNYRSAFSSVEQLENYTAWQSSGLIGLSKKYTIGKKKGNMQLLWDFLSYGQVPRAQAVVFRMGYGIK